MIKYGEGLVSRIRDIVTGDDVVIKFTGEKDTADCMSGSLDIICPNNCSGTQMIQFKILVGDIWGVNGANMNPLCLGLLMNAIMKYTKDYYAAQHEEDKKREEIRRKLTNALL